MLNYRSKPTILVIDDERDTLSLLSIALEKAGFSPITAASWDETAQKIEENYQTGRPIAAAVLDLMMPERSGFDILRSLQVVLTPMPPVIMLTAVTAFEKQIEARELGVARYLTKPTTPQKLADTIRAVLAEKPKSKNTP